MSHTLLLELPQLLSQVAVRKSSPQLDCSVHGLLHTPHEQVRPPEQESVHCRKKWVSLSPPEAASSWQPAHNPLSAKTQSQAPLENLETARLVIRSLRPLALA